MTDTPMTPDKPASVELTEQQLDALSAAGNRALNDHHHEDLCHCLEWPISCLSSGNYFMGAWDTSAFDIGLPAVLGMWETLRNDRHAAKVAELQADNEVLRARVAELETVATAALAPHKKSPDSPHCSSDGDQWPCHTVYALAPAVASRDLRPGAKAARRMIRARQDAEATP
ncbi:hypothetical protein ACGFZC_01135 [[Kitasatospora] papulosa]|uniref:hypothetical protein n=1 Tax=[Kitasatospora] papulosa TaxID=1464011 RepID=UPI003710DF27